jgi:hypothetical protein
MKRVVSHHNADATMNASTLRIDGNVGDDTRVRACVRRVASFKRAMATALLGLSFALLGIVPANATVNVGGPHSTFTWSTCTIQVGDRALVPAYAQADVQASCSTRHTIRSYVYLYRWNGSAWVRVESSNVLTWSNAFRSDNWSSYYVGGGRAYWQTVAYVSLDGSKYYQLAGPVAAFTPAG